MKKKIKLNKNNKGPVHFLSQVLTALLIFLVIILFYDSITTLSQQSEEPKKVSLSDVASAVEAGEVETINVKELTVFVTLKDGTKQVTRAPLQSDVVEALVNLGVDPQRLRTVDLVYEEPSGFKTWFFPLLSIFAPILFLLVLFWFLSRQVRGSAMQAFTFGQSKARMIDPSDKKQRVTFKDVAGSREAKEELHEIVDFLKNPKKFIEIGARIPKGVLLMGPPGTGKTLLARAVAGEANVPFFYLSGSEFVEMFVGVGASRVRDLFKMAKRAAPAIIFIDEIDAVGRHRGSGLGGGHDEREQTLNQILVELDGFEPNEKVIVMAATNRPDVLDTALLRPGRFDRRVVVDLPDVREREEILKIHAEKKSLGEDVDLHVIAQRTPGFSGADLANLMNEAAILAAREGRDKITQYDLIRSVEKVMLGPERKSRVISQHEKRVTAYHEGGHALVASVLPHADPVHKVTIVSRGHAGGYTLKLPLEEKRLRSRKEFLDDIASTLGGYVAEEILFGDITTGASNDIAVATALARDMVTKYGMSDKIGPIAFDSGTPLSYVSSSLSFKEKNYSEEIAAEVDREVARIMTGARDRARDVLMKHRKALDAIAESLMKVETLERDELEKILLVHGITPKNKGDRDDTLSLFSSSDSGVNKAGSDEPRQD